MVEDRVKRFNSIILGFPSYFPPTPEGFYYIPPVAYQFLPVKTDEGLYYVTCDGTSGVRKYIVHIMAIGCFDKHPNVKTYMQRVLGLAFPETAYSVPTKVVRIKQIKAFRVNRIKN